MEASKEDYEEKILKALEKIKASARADEEKYKERLDICRSCDKLIRGTCLSCGCYVELRAATDKNRCPDKKW